MAISTSFAGLIFLFKTGQGFCAIEYKAQMDNWKHGIYTFKINYFTPLSIQQVFAEDPMPDPTCCWGYSNEQDR